MFPRQRAGTAEQKGSLKRTLVRLLLILLIYCLITLIMTYPVVLRLNTHLVGFGDDMWVHYWNNWWVKKTLADGGDLYSTNLLFYPEGASLLYHNFGWLNIAAWLAVEPLAGGVAAYNLVHLLNIALCAFTMFLLARHLLDSDGPAFVAGLVHGFWPYRLSNYGHPNTVSTQWLPLVILCTILLIKAKKPLPYILLLGLSMALTGLSRWQMLLPATIGILLYLLGSFLTGRERWSWALASRFALAALATVLLIAVPFYPLARDLMLDVSTARANMDVPVGTETDVLNYIVPPINHPLVTLFRKTDFVNWRTARTQSTPVRMPVSYFVGYGVLILVGVAVVQRRSEARPWVILGLTAFFLALGPLLRFNRRTYPGIPMPYRLVGWLPPMRLLRKPHRFNILLALPVAILAAHGAAVVKERLRRWEILAVWVVLPALVLFDYVSLPAATVAAHTPEYDRILAGEPGDFALVELPADRQASEYHMFCQTVHGRPLLTGHISRLPPDALDFVSSVPLLDGIYQTGSFDTTLPDLTRQLSLLADAGFRYLILHKNPDLTSPDELIVWRRYLIVSPRYEDEDVVVYSTRPEVGNDCRLQIQLADGIGLVESDLSEERVSPGSVSELQAIWGTTAPLTDDLQLEVRLMDRSADITQQELFDIFPSWPTGEWPADTILRDEYALSIEPRLPAGEYTVTVQLVDSEGDQAVGQAASVGQLIMEAPQKTFSAPPLSHQAEAEFGDVLRLLGYDLRVQQEKASLTLHWRALRRMETSYKFFVHLVHARSDDLAAQADVVPHDWSYPTTWWEANEVVSDRIDLPLDDVSRGIYNLWIGVYIPDTGQRLDVLPMSPDLIAEEGRLRLPDTLKQ